MKPARVCVELSFALMTPTPPREQVEFSKNQMEVKLSVMGTSRVVITVPFTVGRGPELKPLTEELKVLAGMQGCSNCDWRTSYAPLVTVGEGVSGRSR